LAWLIGCGRGGGGGGGYRSRAGVDSGHSVADVWGHAGAEIANVLALPVAALGLAVAVLGWWRRPKAADPAHGRGPGVDGPERRAGSEDTAAVAGRPRPANLGFAQPTPALLRWRTDGGDETGSLETIADFYQALTRGRLVMLGEPGAGKTVLAIQLLLDLTRNWLPNLGPDASAAGVRVPVRLSLPAFLPGPADELSADAAQRRLDDWIARHLVTVHGQRPAVARHLVAKGWVLPILDGLDEMVSALMKLKFPRFEGFSLT
jgi:hypothetical protein